MGMNPETNKFEPLTEDQKDFFELKEDMTGQLLTKLLRPDGTEVPAHWTIFKVGELVVIKNYTFEVKYIGESAILFEPVEQILK